MLSVTVFKVRTLGRRDWFTRDLTASSIANPTDPYNFMFLDTNHDGWKFCFRLFASTRVSIKTVTVACLLPTIRCDP